jgi:hypothetical protein
MLSWINYLILAECLALYEYSLNPNLLLVHQAAAFLAY